MRAKVCSACAAGEVTASAGATSCLLCAEGSYAGASDTRCATSPPGFETRLAGPGAARSTPCQPGFYNDKAGAAFCPPCPPGTFTNTTGVWDGRLQRWWHRGLAAAAADVLPAAAGPTKSAPAPLRPQSSAGRISCDAAPGGYVTGLTATATGATGAKGPGATRIDPCPARHFRPSTFTNNTCSLCSPGRETKKAVAATVCNACLEGWTLLNPLDILCSECPRGAPQLPACCCGVESAERCWTIP